MENKALEKNGEDEITCRWGVCLGQEVSPFLFRDPEKLMVMGSM